MKVFKQASCLLVATLLMFFFTNVRSGKAQMTKVNPDPVIAKADPKHMNNGPRNLIEPAIVTEDGPLKGTNIFGVLGYLGIPYAAPPVGSLRWMPPQPHAKWHEMFAANNFGNFCTQPDGAGGWFGDEDCLTLNVFTPNVKKNSQKKAPLPVMVWIHGGGLVTGGSFIYDPSPLVTQGKLIVVTINYRLGYLGFFAHPAIDAEGHLNGNYGLMDQQFALRWVKRNIGAFGGDPNNVTMFGESAGAQSVYYNLASLTAKDLFQKAIAESGAILEFQDYWDFIVPLATGETVGIFAVPSGEAIASSVGCGSQTAACLRGVSAAALVAQNPAILFPFVDGTVLTQTPTAAFTSGQFNQVPVISGGNHDEWRFSVAALYDSTGHPPETPADYINATDALYGPFAPTVLLYYPLSNYPSPGVALGASGTDYVWACPERNAVRLLSKYVTTYAYEFNDENAPELILVPFATFLLGAYHSAELQYLFDLDERFAGFNPFTPDQQDLSNSMISYWTNFATTGDPNSSSQPVWSPYSSATDQFQSLVPPTPLVESTFASDHQCTSGIGWSLF
jgi:para-nitrobenzyl esterase